MSRFPPTSSITTMSHDPSQQYTQFNGYERRSTDDHAVRLALLEHGMESIKQQLSGINNSISKLVWLVFTALILAVLKMVLIT